MSNFRPIFAALPSSLCMGLCVSLWLFASSVSAQVYSCVVGGRTMSSDRPIPECAKEPMRQTQRSGLTRIIPAPLTAEQRQQQDQEQLKRRMEEDAAREQLRKDRALLASYSSVEKIEEARVRSLKDANEVISSTNERIAALEKDRAADQKDADTYQGKTLPPMLKARLDSIDTNLMLEKKGLAASKADVERINQKYDAEIKRFRQLTASSK